MHHPLAPTLLVLAAALPAGEPITVVAPAGAAEPGQLPPALDTSAALRRQPGLAGIRMGGTGIDPVLRGQSASRLRVLADGAAPQGGCPNRMDPPATYTAAGADQVDVEPGGLSVRHPGAPLGVIRLDRPRPAVGPGRPVEARASGSLDSGGGRGRGAGALSVGGADGWLQGRVAAARAEDYRDGGGAAVRSGYRRWSAGGSLAWTPDAQTAVELAHDRIRESDARYAGAGMDAVFSDGDSTALTLRRRSADGVVASIEMDAYAVEVEHRMDNYSLRPTAGMAMRADAGSDSAGGRLAAEFRLGGAVLGLGVDGEQRVHAARRRSGPAGTEPTALESALIPDVRQSRLGLWTDLALPVAARVRVVPGVRVDAVDSRVAAAGIDPAGAPMSPAALYGLYYGAGAEDRSQTLLGAGLRIEADAGSGITVTAAASRQQRAADPVERAIAANSAKDPAQRWVGNPRLAAETHWLAQVIAAGEHGRAGAWRVEAWIDRVEDRIARDRARGQPGVLRTDRATIYRNAEALLAGAVARSDLATGARLRWSADLAWTWGEDLASGRPLGQIPPLSGTAGGRWGDDDLHVGATARWAARAARVDADIDSGAALDAGETPGWIAIDLAAGWRPLPGWTLGAGIDNLLDRTYAEHLNKPSAYDTAVQRVHEPGRVWWLAAAARL